MGKNIIWIGPRSSDIDNEEMFLTGITTFGNGNYSFCQSNSKRVSRGTFKETKFIMKKMDELYSINPNYQFLLYDQSEAEKYKKYSKNFICINETSIVNILNSKQITRTWLSNDVNCLPFIAMPFSDCNYLRLCQRFPGINTFIIQNTYSVGGTKTYIVKSANNLRDVKQNNKPYEICIISPYIKQSISLNIHLLCSKKGPIIFPYSTQIIKPHNNCLLYVGSDFTRRYNVEIEQKIFDISTFIGNKLCKMGYMGIVGIDFLLANNILYFIEINPRFQGSTKILNIWLKENKYPSIYKMNFDIFNGKTYKYDFKNSQIPYISCNFLSGVKNNYNSSSPIVLISKDHDGWKQNTLCSDGVYMYRNIYRLTQ